MKKLNAEHFSIALFNLAVFASALTMLWLLWHFPVATATSAFFVVAGVALLARVAKTIDVNAGAAARDSSPTA